MIPRRGSAARLLLLLAVAPCAVQVRGARFQFASNPVRRVVQMLQMLQQKADEEFAAEGKLLDAAMCQCSTTVERLKGSVGEASVKIPQLQNTIGDSKAEETELKSDISKSKAERADCQNALDEATKERNSESAVFEKTSATKKANLNSLNQALSGFSSGSASALLQANPEFLVSLQKMVASRQEIDRDDRDAVVSFLQGSSGAQGPSTDEVVGILKQIGDNMAKDLDDITTADQQAAAAFEKLKSAKEGQIASTDAVVKEKSNRLSEVTVAIVNDVEELEQTQAQLKEDQKMLEEEQSGCKDKQESWAARVRTRKEENECIADTIQMLNGQMTRQLFRSTFPGPAPTLLQIGSSGTIGAAHRAQRMVSQATQGGDARISLLAVSTKVTVQAERRAKARRKGFAKIVDMVTGMLSQLEEEQAVEDKKRDYCQKGLDAADDKDKALENEISDREKERSEGTEQLAVIAEEVSVLEKGIQALDQQVQAATEQRKAEHDDYFGALKEKSAAKEVLIMARGRLKAFYGEAKLLQVKDTVTAQTATTLGPRGNSDSATESDADVALEALGGAASFVQVDSAEASDSDEEDEPVDPEEQSTAPNKETQKLYPLANKGGASDVMALIDTLVSDLDKDTAEMEKNEKEAQQEYEIAQKFAVEKRRTDVKAMSSREAVRVKLEEKMHNWKLATKAKRKDLEALKEYTADLHKDCDGLLKNYDLLKQTRSDEVGSLRSAKAILMDADAPTAEE